MQTILEQNELVRVFDSDTGLWKLIKENEDINKQLSTIEDALSKFGLLKNEIKVYVYLAQIGEAKAGEIAGALSLHRTETYKILRDLERKGIVCSILAKPLKFTAITLEKTLDLLIEVQKSKIKQLERKKPELLKLWLAMPKSKLKKTNKELFQMLEGEQQVLLKAEQLLEKAESEFSIFAPDSFLNQLFYSDFTDKLKKRLNHVNINLLTENSPKSAYFLKKINWPKENCREVDASHHPNLPCFMVIDNKEILISFHDRDFADHEGGKRKMRTAALWTNYPAFISVLQTLFLQLLLKHEA